MAKAPRPRPSTWERVDGLLLIAAVALAALVALRILSWLAGAIALTVEAALVVLVVVVIARLAGARRR